MPTCSRAQDVGSDAWGAMGVVVLIGRHLGIAMGMRRGVDDGHGLLTQSCGAGLE